MALNVNIKKKEKQSSADVLKQFQKLVKSAGVVTKLKSIKFHERKESDFKKKAAALKKINKTVENDRLRKLGKKVNR
jgi:DNA-binding GntR family transcriptional regulator